MSAAPRFVVEFEAVRDVLNREPIVRLRTLLKLGLRGLGLRCVRIEELDVEQFEHEGTADG